ncbi:TetR family transcriptional regulator [Pseudonocardia xinjiangensis]|uniref:TetR family transcriptional regulator n=1 Tax=Pseudonocardia xinjiangensis TaxID=75289 RepID=UPI003D8BDAE8
MTDRVVGEQGDVLLDAAERVLLAEGLPGLSVRRVTAEAGVNVAAVNYVFGGKDALLRALLRRLLRPVTEERISRIDTLVAAGHPTVAELVEAFVEPLMTLHQRLGSQFGELLVRLPQDEDQLRTSGGSALEPGIERMLDALAPVLPDLPRDILRLRLGMLIGTVIAYTVGVVRLESLDESAELKELLAFVTAGLAA